MARQSVRGTKKLTAFQLTESLQMLQNQVHILSTAVGNDVRRLNILLFALLKEMGKVEEIECPRCDVMNLRPTIDDLEVDPNCAECGARLRPETDYVDEAIKKSEDWESEE